MMISIWARRRRATSSPPSSWLPAAVPCYGGPLSSRRPPSSVGQAPPPGRAAQGHRSKKQTPAVGTHAGRSLCPPSPTARPAVDAGKHTIQPHPRRPPAGFSQPYASRSPPPLPTRNAASAGGCPSARPQPGASP